MSDGPPIPNFVVVVFGLVFEIVADIYGFEQENREPTVPANNPTSQPIKLSISF